MNMARGKPLRTSSPLWRGADVLRADAEHEQDWSMALQNLSLSMNRAQTGGDARREETSSSTTYTMKSVI